MNNPLDLFAWKVRSERKRQHLTQRKLAERLNMNARTIIDLETCQSNPKFETVALVAKELNISVDAAIFPDMVNQTVSKTVVDFFAGKSEAEIEKYIALCKQAEVRHFLAYVGRVEKSILARRMNLHSITHSHNSSICKLLVVNLFCNNSDNY